MKRLKKGGGPSFDKEDRAALHVLETKLKSLIGDVEVAKLRTTSLKINLETLGPEEGFGMLDGLKGAVLGGDLVITTPELFRAFVPSIASDKGCDALKRLSTGVFTSEASAAIVTSLPTNTPKNLQLGCAGLANEAQDAGPFPPNRLVVLARKGHLMIAWSKLLPKPLPQIAACEKLWKHGRSDAQNSVAYDQCYARESSSLPSVQALAKEADSVLNQL